MVSIDVETSLIAPGLLAPPLACVSIAGLSRLGVLDAKAGVQASQRLLLADSIVGHNIAYDLSVLISSGVEQALVFRALDEGRVLDTMLADQLLAIARGDFDQHRYRLADLVKRRLGMDLEKGEVRTSFGKLRHQPIESWPVEAIRYSKADALATLKVRESIDAERHAERWGDLLADEPAQVRAAFGLQLTSAWGLRTDPVAVAALKADLLKQKEAQDSKLFKMGVLRADGTKDTKALQRLVEEAYASTGQEVPRTEKGAVQTSRDTLLRSGDDVLMDIAEGGKAAKFLSTYIPWLELGTTTPINARYVSLVSTGRTSSREPNIQNQPKRGGIRECFIPRPGYVFVDADYSTLELRAWAQAQLDLLGESEMAAALWAEYEGGGPDLHTLLAAEIYDLDPSVLFARVKAGDKEADDMRKLAKAGNFGLPGGMGVDNFINFARAAYKVSLDPERATTIKTAWLKRWKAQDFFRTMKSMQDPIEQLIDIRLKRSQRVHGRKRFTEACNLTFQGPSADGAKLAVYETQKRTRLAKDSALYGSRVVAFIHDELLLEIPKDRGQAAAKELEEIMIKAMQIHIPDVPITVDAGVVEKWGQ
jgi:DNA polymerase I-like protein with 3'-5' exonuclease and polymerase domains